MVKEVMAKHVETFNLDDDFLIFKERLDLYFMANEITDDKKKQIQLLTSISVPVYKLIRNMCSPSIPSDKSYDDLIMLLEGQFIDKTVLFKERRRFYEAHQGDGEKVLEYYNRIQAMAVGCEFKTNLKSVLRDKFICGLVRGNIFERLCQEEDKIEIEECVKIAQAKEAAGAEEKSVHKIHKKKFNKNFQYKNTKCKACGDTHSTESCKYKSYKCKVCFKVGHLAKVCDNGGSYKNKRGKRQNGRGHHCIEKEETKKYGNYNKDEADDDDFQLFCSIDVIDTAQVKSINTDNLNNYNKFDIKNVNFSNSYDSRLFTVVVEVEQIAVKFELDTGSAISAIPYDLYKEKFGNLELKPYTSLLKAYNGMVIESVGYIEAEVQYQGRNCFVKFVIIKKGCRPLIGRDIFRELRFGIELNAVSSDGKIQKLLEEHHKLFSDKLGMYTGDKICLKVKPDVRPIFIRPRNVPFAYKEKLEVELDRLESLGVITRIETSDYGTPLVTVVKQDGSLRICADYSVTINNYLEDVNYPIPKIDDLLRALQGGKFFSKIDLSQAYHQLAVDDETGKILAWSTHRGTYKVNRLPFGCRPNTQIFQSVMEKTLLGCKGTVVFIDDILVTGRTTEEHMENLKEVFRRLENVGFTANLKKCSFFQSSVRYLGYIIDEQGLHKDEKKTEAIVKMPRPKSVTEVKAFCGMINYYGRFLPNISSILKPLYSCVSAQKVEWSEKCEEAFQKAKVLIVSDMVLAHYDPDKPVVLTTDASESGIAACLSHMDPNVGDKPIAFVSRTLSKAEQNYSAIDREALAIYVGVKKMEQFLLGRKFTIQTDHKPLVAIFGKKTGIPSMAASRLQRWAVYLSNFWFDIKHIAGKNNSCADALSRLACIGNSEKADDDFSYLKFVENEFHRPN